MLSEQIFKSTIEQIRHANTTSFRNPQEVESYITKPYHAVRICLGIKLISQEIKLSFNTLASSKVRVLELGSSSGQIAQMLSKFGYRVLASDFELAPLELCKLLGLQCVRLDASSYFPFQSESFHAIFMGELIEHIFDTSLLLSECHRVLCDNGVLVITTPNLARLQDRIRFIFGRSPRQVNPLHHYLKLHIRPFSYSLLRDILSSKGFVPRKVLSNFVEIEYESSKLVRSRFLASLFPKLGSSLIVSARKRSVVRHNNS